MSEQLDSITEVLEDLKAGKPVIIVDDESRENEGDLIIAAEFATQENINFMVKYARGIVCTPMRREALEKLGFDRLRTVTRMIKEYGEGNLTLDELTRLVINYDFGLIDIPATIVGDVAPGPAEGEVGWELSRAFSRKQLSYDDYDHIYWAQRA